jgi:hypothetical protein
LGFHFKRFLKNINIIGSVSASVKSSNYLSFVGMSDWNLHFLHSVISQWIWSKDKVSIVEPFNV